MEVTIAQLAAQAYGASTALAQAPADIRNRALHAQADALEQQAEVIFAANREDLTRSQAEGLAAPLLKRLKFDQAKLASVCDGLRQLAAMADPLSHVQVARELDAGLTLRRVSCPIGVIGVIFESRPDALVQIGALCLKSGNAALLKGGAEALHTNRVLFTVLHDAAMACGLPQGYAALLETRQDVADMLAQDEHVSLIIPRGSNAFVRYIMDHTRIPVMGHADGICHVYVDRAADVDMAVAVVADAKTQYVAVCNAAETLLVHADIAEEFLPRLKAALDAAHTSIRGDGRTRAIIDCAEATDEDWDTEYLDYILSIKIVDSLDEAIDHINRHGSHHTDAIVTGDAAAAARFQGRVDSAGVYWNVSTRFADGYVYGLGAEVGISTGKLHARGPVGLDGLITYKYLLDGGGHIMADYAAGRKQFHHREL